MIRRVISLLALVLAAGAGLGAARAPGDPALTITGPGVVTLGDLATYTVQLSGLGADPPPGTAIVVTLPAGVTYAPTGDQLESCTGQGTQVITCPAGEPADPLRWTLRTYFHAPTMKVGDQLTIGVAAGDLTATITSTVGPGADLGVTEVTGPKLPLIAGRPFRFTAVVHNFGPGTARYVTLVASTEGLWYHGYGKLISGPGECFPDPGTFICDIPEELAPGEELRVEYEMGTSADAKTFGRKSSMSVSVHDFPGGERPINRDNNEQGFPLAFAPRPSSSVPASPPPPQDHDDGDSGGGLPITGPSAGAPVAAGAALLLAGAVLIGATRRRRKRS